MLEAEGRWEKQRKVDHCRVRTIGVLSEKRYRHEKTPAAVREKRKRKRERERERERERKKKKKERERP